MNHEQKTAVYAAMKYMDWFGLNAAWIFDAIKKEYSYSKAQEFAELLRDGDKTRETLRRMYVAANEQSGESK